MADFTTKKFLSNEGVATLWTNVVNKINAANADQTAALEAEVARAKAAEAQALTDAKAYTDGVKEAILGEGISETFDTLVEIQQWIEGDGVNATELASEVAALSSAITTEKERAEGAEADLSAAIDAEKTRAEGKEGELNTAIGAEKTRAEAAESALSGRIDALEGNAGGYATVAEVATAKQEAIDAAAADATTKADAAEADANAYTDTECAKVYNAMVALTEAEINEICGVTNA